MKMTEVLVGSAELGPMELGEMGAVGFHLKKTRASVGPGEATKVDLVGLEEATEAGLVGLKEATEEGLVEMEVATRPEEQSVASS